MEPTICTAFMVFGDASFVPEELSIATGIASTSSHRLGEINRAGRSWKESCWKVEVGPDPSLDHGAQVEQLVEVIESASLVLREFRNRLALETCIRLWWSDTDESQSNPFIVLSSELLFRIAALDAAIEIDV